MFNKLDPVALGLAVGSVGGLALCATTTAVALGGQPQLTGYLGLLGQYLPGYRVEATGSLLGLFYGLGAGFAGGWLFAFARNAALALYLAVAYRRTEKRVLQRLFDHFF